MDVYLCEDIDPYGYGFHHTGGIATHSDRFFYRCTTQVVIPHTHTHTVYYIHQRRSSIGPSPYLIISYMSL